MTLLERLQREAREKATRATEGVPFSGLPATYTFTRQDLHALIAHTIKEAAKEIEKKKVLNGYCGYSFTGQTIDIKSAVECIHGAERMGYNQALTDAQKVLTEGTSQTK